MIAKRNEPRDDGPVQDAKRSTRLPGAWPMLIQIPFFIAFYWVLLESVEDAAGALHALDHRPVGRAIRSSFCRC